MGESGTRVCVSNLDANTSDAEFVSYFRRNCAGVVYGSDAGNIVRDGIGRSKGFGFINFIDSLSANVAVSKRNHVINGKRVNCKLARGNRNGPLHLRKLYVGNLNVGTTEDHLKDYFSRFGQIVYVSIQYDENDRSCCYGYVEFSRLSILDKVQAERPHKVNDKDIQTSRTYPKGVPVHLRRASTVLYVLNNNERITKEDIETYFGNYKILSVSESNEFVEIHFADYDDVDKICLRGESHIVKGGRVIASKSLKDLREKLNGTTRSIEPSAPSLTLLSSSQDRHRSAVNILYKEGQQTVVFPSYEMTAMNPQHMRHNRRSSYSRRSSSPYRYRSNKKNDDCCVIL